MKKFLVIATISCTAIMVNAAPLTPAAALQRALGEAPEKIKGKSPAHTDLAFTINSQRGAPALYMFNRGTNGGFLAVSADDTSIPLLGYCTTGDLPADMSTLPDGMRYWLQSLSEQVAYNADHASESPAKVKASAADSWENIAPLTATRWNQDFPYNNLCPEIGTRRCYTGCVATAMAQAMKYYNYPAKGTGTHSYTWTYSENGTEKKEVLALDYDTITYNWDLMLDRYGNDDSDEAQRRAVATLMYSCGVAVDMDYGTSSSGAVSFDMVRAFVDNFSYGKGLRFHIRDYYGIDEWNQMIYENLRDYGPVLYGGQSNDGGHQFICDGYQDGYFHFNWGWGGMSDGYFVLTALDPESQGIGGSTSGYNFSQDVLLRLTPTPGGEQYEQILWDGDFNISDTTTEPGGKISYNGAFFNYSYGAIDDAEIGLCLTPSDGGTPIYRSTGKIGDLPSGRGLRVNWSVTLPDSLPDGVYTITPAMIKANGEMSTIPTPINNRGSYTLRINNGEGVITPVNPADISAEDLKAVSELHIDQTFKVTATLFNTSYTEEYYGDLLVGLEKDGTMVAKGGKTDIDLLPGEVKDWEYVSTFEATPAGGTLTAGNYDMYLYKVVNGKAVKVTGPVSVELQAESTPTLKVTDLVIEDGQPLDNMHATATLECESGYFAGTLTLFIFPAKGGRSMASYDSNFIIVQADASAEESAAKPAYSDILTATGSTPITFDFNFGNGAENTEYEAGIYNDGKWVSNFVRFRTGLDVGVDSNVAESSAVTEQEYYSLTGVRLGTSRPDHSGIYIVRSHHDDGRITTKRVMLK